MHSINGNDITLTRGDTLMVQLTLIKGTEPYVPQAGDVIRFALKQKYSDADADVKINKQIPTDTLVLKILPEETKPLLMGKTYVYDIELTDASGNVDTFISGKFTITEEVL